MKQRILYESYHGSEPYIFLLFDKTDGPAAAGIVNALIDRQFRICYRHYDPKEKTDYEALAGRIFGAQLAVFLISRRAQERLVFRNSINYALSKNKKIFCIYLDDHPIRHGFDIQLANAPGLRASLYPNADALCAAAVQDSLFVQDMRGEDALESLPQGRKKKAAIAAIVAVVAVFAVSAVFISASRAEYMRSKAGKLEQLTQAEYMDISGEKASVAGLLDGKSIGTLVARDMGLESAEPFASFDCADLDISHNPGIPTLEPLLENPSLQTVRVSQDMLAALSRISGQNNFDVVITE